MIYHVLLEPYSERSSCSLTEGDTVTIVKTGHGLVLYLLQGKPDDASKPTGVPPVVPAH